MLIFVYNALWVSLPSKFDRTNLAMSGQNDMEIEFCLVNDLTLKNLSLYPDRYGLVFVELQIFINDGSLKDEPCGSIPIFSSTGMSLPGGQKTEICDNAFHLSPIIKEINV